MSIWDKDKRTFTNPNELHNEEEMKSMFEGIHLKTLYLDKYPRGALKNKLGNFDEADIQKSYAWAQGKDDETVTIASRSNHIGKKLQAQTKTASLTGLNIAPFEYPFITSGLT